MLGFATRPMSDHRTPDRGPAADYVFTAGSLPAGVTLTRASSATVMCPNRLGAEQVVNGTFVATTAGWSLNGAAALSWSAGAMRVTSAGGGGPFQDVSVTPGALQVVTASLANISGSGANIIVAYDGAGFGAELARSTSVGAVSLVVRPASSTLRLYCFVDGTRVADFDDISAKPLTLNDPADPVSLVTVPAGVARFEYDPVTLACRGLLREGAATNLFPQSNLSNWGIGNTTRTLNAADGPRGPLTMTKIEATTTNFTNCSTVFTAPASVLTFSIFRKKGTGTLTNVLTLYNNTTALDIGAVTINYDTGAVAVAYGPVTTRSTDMGNGVWLHEITTTGAGVTTGNTITAYVFAGGTVPAGEYAFYDCAQVEAGARATSRILTTGSAATRAADVVAANTNCAGAGECSIALDFDWLKLIASGLHTYPVGSLFNSSPCLYYLDTVSGAGVYAVSGLGAKTPPVAIGRHKAAASIKSGDTLYTHDGLTPTSASTTFSLAPVGVIGIGNEGTQASNMLVERLRIWPRTMSPAELQAVTT